MIQEIDKMAKYKINQYFFQGVITPKRKWVKNYNGIIINSDYGRDETKKYNLDIPYYQNMCKSKFTLCPTGDCPWSYRFFEAILCFSIPIMEKNTDDIFCKDYYYFVDGEEHEYSLNMAIKNYELLMQRMKI